MRRVLTGHCILLVHEDDFRCRYVADVIVASGAVVIGPARSAYEALMLLDGGKRPAALVLSAGVGDGNEVARSASQLGVAVLHIGADAGRSRELRSSAASLSPPFAGFQVVDALAELLNLLSPLVDPHRHEH